jgi:hypothetical protein
VVCAESAVTVNIPARRDFGPARSLGSATETLFFVREEIMPSFRQRGSKFIDDLVAILVRFHFLLFVLFLSILAVIEYVRFIRWLMVR